MHIKKLNHCCMLIDAGPGNKTRILTDPGIFSMEQHDKVSHADIVLITHEHPDHLHIESLKALLQRAPEATVIVNDSVGELLMKEGIKHHVMKHGDTLDVKGVHLEGIGNDHATIHKSLPHMANTGFFIDNKLFYPGDALTDPKKPVDALALPVAGPWLKISEALDYAAALKPRIAFPVHDGIVPRGFMYHVLEKVLTEQGIEFIKLEAGGELDVK